MTKPLHLITDLESLIDPISILFTRARDTGNLDVPAPNSMIFDDNSSITLVWDLTKCKNINAIDDFNKIKSLSSTDFVSKVFADLGIIVFRSEIKWHGYFPDVFFKVILPYNEDTDVIV